MIPVDPSTVVSIDEVVVSERMRKEMGDVDGLSRSIEENGLINPIILTRNGDNKIILVAGERRFQALKKLGVVDLNENEHFRWRADIATDEYRRVAIELEENIRRKSLTWSEEIVGKQKLLDIYQRIYGPPAVGGLSRQERIGMKPQGFGVRKLSELLGESPTNTSEDLQLAGMLKSLPALALQPTKEAAKRTLELALKMVGGKLQPLVVQPLIYKILITCNDEQHQQALLLQFRQLGLDCKPIVA